MRLSDIKKNAGVCLWIVCALTFMFGSIASVWGDQQSQPQRPPQPKQPTIVPDELKTVDTPKIFTNVPDYQNGSPYAIDPTFFWQTNAEPPVAKLEGQEQGNIHYGALQLHPVAAYKQTYDTNVFLGPRGQEEMDWISDYLVGIAAKTPIIPSRAEDFIAAGEYHANFLNFMRFDKNDRVDHTAHVALRGNFDNGIGLKFTEDFLKTQDPANNEFSGLQKRIWNQMDGRANYTHDKITIETAYTVIMNRYIKEHDFSNDDHMVSAIVYYNLSAKTRLLNEFNVGRILYYNSSTNSNSYYIQDRIGAEGKIAPKLTGTAKFGFRAQEYARDNAKDLAQLVAFGNLKYELSERTNLNLYGESRPEESTYTPNNYYTSNIVGFKGEHLLTNRIALEGGIFWAYDLYPEVTTEGDSTGKRRDTLCGANVGVKYELRKWWLLNAGYLAKQRDSRFHNFNYNDQQVSLRTSFLF